jgi:hypothetical protein
MEVVLNPTLAETETMASTLEVNSQEKDDSIVQEEEKYVGQAANPAQQEITPERIQIEDETTLQPTELMAAQLVKAVTTQTTALNTNMSRGVAASSEMKANDGFLTPSKKHQVPAAVLNEPATAMEGVIVTNNSYLPLTSLGTMRSRGNTLKKSLTSGSPRKKKMKVTPKFMQAMEAVLDKQQEALESGLDPKLPG